MNISQKLAVPLTCALLLSHAVMASSQNGYQVAAPPGFPTFNTPSPSAWAATNGCSVVWTSGGSSSLTGGLYPEAQPQNKPKYRLIESAIGSPLEHIKPEYYLGDRIVPPANVDWEATYARMLTSQAYSNSAVFYDASKSAIYFSKGGLIQVVWDLNNGSRATNNYQVSGVSSKKPYRIFWTDAPFHSPPVDLSGKFVKFFGDTNVITVGYGMVTNTSGGIPSAMTNVVRGLFLDPSTHWLQALGGVKGQVVMGYYSTGNFDDLLGTIVVEVCAPSVKTMPVDIGRPLQPTGDGYDVVGLNALVTKGVTSEDNVGPYVYQYKGAHSYSPKNGNFYAIRTCVDAPWKIEVYWRQQDLMGTTWPFEVLNYACDWPVTIETYVRGNQAGDLGLSVPIPSAYTPTLMEFQEPAGHAVLVNNLFSTQQSGYSLLKLTGTDVNGDGNIWFVPIQSIWRDAPQFDQTPLSWPVGVEVEPLPSAMALSFDGSSAYLQTPITIQLSGSFTIECYFQCEPTAAWQTLFYKNAASNEVAGALDFQLQIGPQGQVLATLGSATNHVNAVSNAAPVAVVLGDGLWHHVALVYDQDATNCTLSLDGMPSTSRLTAPRLATYAGALVVGRPADPANPSYHAFKGKVDDIRVWARALSGTEIAESRVGFLRNAATITNVVAYYPIEDGIGRVIKDASGHGNDAAMVNSIRVAAGAVGLSDVQPFNKYHGYIYEAASGNNYNTNLYVRADATPATNTEASTSESYIFAVNKTPANGQPLEVWWSREVLQAAMPAPIWIPSWVQCYRFGWLTEALSYPTITLASQLGSAGKSLVKRGAALDFSKSVNSTMQVGAGSWFAGAAYTVECWVKPHNLGSAGQVFDFGNGNSTHRVALTVLADGHIQYVVNVAAGETPHTISPGDAPVLRLGWNHLALAVAGGQASVYQDGRLVYGPAGDVPAWAGVTTTNNYLAMGAPGGVTNSLDGAIDEFAVWGVARSHDEIYNDMLAQLTGTELDLRLYYPFDAADVGNTTAANSAYDLSQNHVRAVITDANWILPGAPQLAYGASTGMDAPFVYCQNDKTLPGYNPNEEHAFIEASGGGYVTYALRNDLNQADSSEPYVLVQYSDPNDSGRPNMIVYQVVATNQLYTNFAGAMIAGTLLPGPHPLDLLPNPWNTSTYWQDANGDKNSPQALAYRDRKLQIWAKRAGTNSAAADLEMHNFYPMQDGFNFPSLVTQPALGKPLPWLCRMVNPEADVLAGAPQPWTWTVSWPDSCPAISIGQTLTTATLGLPEVWNDKSLTLLYEPKTDSVALYDPIVIQTTELDFEGDFAGAFGFTSGPNGNIQLKNGKTYFKGVPPNISDRLYFDPAAPKTACLKLAGRRVAPAGGISYLQLNVLNAKEREVLKGLASGADDKHKAKWETAIEELATDRVDADEAHAVVNYALTHMGPGAGGYVTLIENNATNPVFNVKAGDPIQMHIIQLSSNLFAGAVLPLQDPNNLLSEQLDILYTESFAGNGDGFYFEWKRAEPNPNGTTPTDYTNQYHTYLQSAGLTRFTIGQQGDTLPDMVNTFYVMRYRALPANADAYAVTGGAWSDWVRPTLAEGWVQRVLNSVTPFTQRMQDLYDNPAETAVSMIQQAGAPYEGDVSLNQDNLTSVGLIQLYQTVLNKAESMSLRLGINNTAANQQLMLAATRLNDLYMLLGNEAYADAMDPTIGFGCDFINSQDYSLGSVDYGALSSSLFCFDNLCPNLRSEELALLRGRSDQLAPALQLSPAYNRLYWNFTKGITAGEVAYAMNYQIQGSEPTIDQPQAAALYPQGHGDAWGHYLSALTGYYRLMRNPWFSWGTPSITPMMVGDAVVDADYYDEEKFAESAAAMARTSVDIIKRTCEQSFVENGGTPLAGYVDSDPNRAFGYGEWGARAGLASLYNWAAANSLLPPDADPASYDFLHFATNTQLACTSPSSKIDFSSDFTIEFKVNPDAALQRAEDPCFLFDWHGNGTNRSDAGAVSIALDPPSGKLVMLAQGVNLCMEIPPCGTWSHVAITYSAALEQMTFFMNGATNASFTQVIMPTNTMLATPQIDLASSGSPVPFAGALSEFRIWNVAREPAALWAARDGVSANAAGLLMCQRFIAASAQGFHLQDEACSAFWTVVNPVWQAQAAAGVNLTFTDNSILRINRDSVGSLAEICAAMKDVQRHVDMADAGMTPLGLSGNAIPFDIDPAALASGQSHFEQIEQRAEQALANAATLLDRAQTASKLQRQQTQNAINTQQDLVNEEAATDIQLVGIFGYPYEADIGAGATYPQGYDGPDLYHYMYMDLSSFGFKEFELSPKTSTVYHVNGLLLNGNTNETMALHFDLASNGMVLMPPAMQGTRRSQGSLQAAYGAFIQAYLAYKTALQTYGEKVDFLKVEANWAGSKIGVNALIAASGTALNIVEVVKAFTTEASLWTVAGLEIADAAADIAKETAVESVPKSIIAGVAAGGDVLAPARAGLTAAIALPAIALKSQIITGKAIIEMSKMGAETQTKIYELVKDAADLTFEDHATVAEVEKLVMEVNDAAMALAGANSALINAQESYKTVLSQGEQLLAARERFRKQAVNRIAAGRYQDMAFRTFRSDALAKYGNAFDLAQTYTYLATKAYDYETALGLSSAYGSDSIFREIVGARTIGFMDNGVAQLGGLHGDGGLADILAQLKANWLVLKGRLGINNPQAEQCWLSLRSECFRIEPAGAVAAKAWQDKLSAFWVDDLQAVPEFKRLCLPFESSTGLLPQEPALVIPFSTTIDFAKNVFGWPLAGNDHAFDSSYYATKISKMGVKFIGYNQTTYTVVALSATPRVYLIPVGNDVMRSPGKDGGQLLAYNVVDQVVPLPFPLGSSTLDDPDWSAIYDAYTGSGDPLATIRRYPSLRAYYDQSADADAMLSNTRLVGRSVWNTRWLLIIPAGTLNADRTFALDTLIRGADLNKDGKLDQPGIQDIQIGFQTYSNSGN
jgi:hypothetical protein